MTKLAVIAGDGIGPEVVAEALKILDAVLPGVEITDDGHKEGLNGVDNGRLAFHGVRVPRENLLDRYGAVDADVIARLRDTGYFALLQPRAVGGLEAEPDDYLTAIAQSRPTLTAEAIEEFGRDIERYTRT